MNLFTLTTDLHRWCKWQSPLRFDKTAQGKKKIFQLISKKKMAITRDFINPIMKNVPLKTRPTGYLGAVVMASIAAINPKSYFTQPYIGAISWLILSLWFYNENPLHMVRPKPGKKALITDNPKWYQTFKALLWGMLFNPIPMFFIYLVMLVLARATAKTFSFL
jgi:hypothetical protein